MSKEIKLFFNDKNEAEMLKEDYCIYCDSEKSLNKIIVAAQKSKAEKLFPEGETDIVACPRCGSGEYLHNEDKNQNTYCGQCGQKLDWNIEEGIPLF